MKLNQDKCHLLVSGYKHENIWARIGEVKIWESSKQKLLGVVIDRDLSFNEYVSSLCKKAVRKLSVLSRLSNLMSFQQRRLLMKSFVEAQFGYCPLVWMFHGRELNRNINYMKDPYTLSIDITIALSRIYFKKIILSVFTIETSRVWSLNYSK